MRLLLDSLLLSVEVRTTSDDSLFVVLFDNTTILTLEMQEMKEYIVDKLLKYEATGSPGNQRINFVNQKEIGSLQIAERMKNVHTFIHGIMLCMHNNFQVNIMMTHLQISRQQY